MQDRYKNKYFSILSDSISTLKGYSQPEYAAFYDSEKKIDSRVYIPSDTWWGQVIDHFGGKRLVNNSLSGSTVTKSPKHEVPSYGCSDERTSALNILECFPHVIMVFLGLNDFGSWVELTPNEGTDEEDLSVFSVAYGVMLEKLKKNYPNSEIWCITLPVCTRKDKKDYKIIYRRGKHSIDEFCDVIRHSAEKHGCRLIDIYDPFNPYDTFDGLHPNREGMKTLSDAVIANFNKEVRK